MLITAAGAFGGTEVQGDTGGPQLFLHSPILPCLVLSCQAMDSQLTYAAGRGHYVSPSLGPGASLRAMNPKMLKNETRSAQVRRGLLLKVEGGEPVLVEGTGPQSPR